MFKKILIAVAVLLLVGAFFLFKDYDSPELGQKLLDQVSDATGVELAATGFRFNLLEGVELDQVSAKSESDGRAFEFTLDRLVFEHRLGPLLSGTVAIDRIVLDRPEILLVESGGGEATEEPTEETTEEPEAVAAGDADDDGGLALEVRQILIQDGTLVVRNSDDGSETRVEGFDFTMEDLAFDPTAHSLAALSATGQLGIDQIAMEGLTLREMSSAFQLSEAVFDLSDFAFLTPHGAFSATGKVDFNPVPFTYTLAAVGDPLDVNGMMGATSGFGPATLQLDVEGLGADVADVVADGALNLDAGEFPDVPMFSGIDQALGKQVVTGAAYEKTSAVIRLEDNIVRLMPFRFTSEFARLDLDGTVNLAGPLALTLAVATPRDGLSIEGVGGTMLDVLADDEGWVPIPMTVSGTLDDAKVRPDAKTLVAQAGDGAKREVKEAATDAAGDALRGLLRRKRND